MKKQFYYMAFLLMLSFGSFHASAQGLLISEVLTNPNGSDSPFEYVELIATQSINFSVTPYAVVFNNNGTATSSGWIAGGAVTYGFSITTGAVNIGDVVYVGGSSMIPAGIKLRTINTGAAAGDRFGSANAGGVLGNGGVNADAVAVFDISINSITSSTVPIDAIFYGTGTGSAVVSGGSAGYQLPVNDKYAGGKLQAGSFFINSDPANDEIYKATGTFNISSGTFTIARVWTKTTTTSSGTSSITLESSGVSINTTPSSLNFSTTVGTPSPVQTYSLQGAGLTSDVTITAPAQFGISSSIAGPFISSYTITAAAVNAGPLNVYVRYNPATGGIHSGNITNASGIVTTNVAVSGAGSVSLPIYAIQGNGATSPYNNIPVITEGIVTADFQASSQLSGFFIQAFPGDGDPLTSDGIFIYDHAFGVDVSVGDLVQVKGLVNEFNNLTEINNISSITKISAGNSFTSTSVSLPVAASIDWEKYEGMYVQFGQVLTVSENYSLGRFGELTLSSDGRKITPTNFIDPNDNPASGTNSSGTSNVVAVTAQQDLNDRRSIVLDDNSNVEDPPVVPFLNPADTTLRTGTTLNNLTGILDYAFGAYRIEPTVGPAFTYAPRPSVPTVGNANIKIASFNVLNYFNGNGSGGGFPTARGANTLTEFNRQRAKIIKAITQLNADVTGIMEMENDGDADTSAIADLVNGLNAATAPGTYSFVPAPAGINGNSGTDSIKVAMIYKPNKVGRIGVSKADINAINNRPPLAQTFSLTSNGEKFTVIVNHFKSKGCTDATGTDIDQADGQSCYNDRRKLQANELLAFIAQIQASSGDNDVISIGDYNAYEQEDPIDILVGGGLKNLITGNYSYVFDSQSGSLDHAMTTSSLYSSVTGAEKWHINADEPVVKDYNQEFNAPYLYKADAYRSSDHDPVLIGLHLGVECPSDINHDGTTSQADLNLLYIKFGTACVCPEDINKDGMVSQADLNLLYIKFGTACH